MIFDDNNPLKTDPFYRDIYSWYKSKQDNAYYAWVTPIVEGVSFHPELDPLKIELGYGAELYCYYGQIKQNLLYRIVFTEKFPHRFIIKPTNYCMFWSFGVESGQSKQIKYFYRDRYLSLHSWTDKASFLAVLRQQHYETTLTTIWTR